jgi:tetratricopeptide (TPR) repeat protein
MRRLGLFTLALALPAVLLAQDVQDPGVDHFREGEKYFGMQDYGRALEEFRKADEIVPGDATIHSWLAACLNALGRPAEAKEHIETAFEVLEEIRRRDETEPPIAMGFYALLGEIQINLRQYDEAVRTILSYEVPDPQNAELVVAADGMRKGARAKLVHAGIQCLKAADVECAKSAFSQADVLDPDAPPAVQAVAKDALSRATRAPFTTDEEKASKAELYTLAIAAGRLWVQTASNESIEAQRVLVKALSGTKSKEGYQEAASILTAIAQGQDAAARDPSIHLDLATVYTGLEDWEQVITAASAAIDAAPEDPLGEGYCKRSYAKYRLGKCPEAIEDGARCKGSDGSPRPLRHVDTCKQRQADQHAKVVADREANLRAECGYLEDRVRWAVEESNLSLDDLVEVIRDFQANVGRCAPYFEAPVGTGSAATLCAAGVDPASYPLNLSARSRDELEQLRVRIEDFASLCKSSLDATQIAGVNGGLQKVDQALSIYR